MHFLRASAAAMRTLATRSRLRGSAICATSSFATTDPGITPAKCPTAWRAVMRLRYEAAPVLLLASSTPGSNCSRIHRSPNLAYNSLRFAIACCRICATLSLSARSWMSLRRALKSSMPRCFAYTGTVSTMLCRTRHCWSSAIASTSGRSCASVPSPPRVSTSGPTLRSTLRLISMASSARKSFTRGSSSFTAASRPSTVASEHACSAMHSRTCWLAM
mmetsp:Transcript_63104/g.148642  ORF Transcript_63104/g.148642 Transcript_63104/m.148642 type:complete len:218 (+) Transcript_63104:255-908(+)